MSVVQSTGLGNFNVGSESGDVTGNHAEGEEYGDVKAVSMHKRKRAPKPKLTSELLMRSVVDEKEFHRYFKKVRMTGKRGAELDELTQLLQAWEAWARKQFPFLTFSEFIARSEKLCTTRSIAHFLPRWRRGELDVEMMNDIIETQTKDASSSLLSSSQLTSHTTIPSMMNPSASSTPSSTPTLKNISSGTTVQASSGQGVSSNPAPTLTKQGISSMTITEDDIRELEQMDAFEEEEKRLREIEMEEMMAEEAMAEARVAEQERLTQVQGNLESSSATDQVKELGNSTPNTSATNTS